MKTLLTLLACLSFCAVTSATEIVGWKAPLTKYASAGLETEGIARIEVPPNDSPFFQPGDELWDLSKVLGVPKISTAPLPEWIVWNATSGRIIANAHRNTIWQLDSHLRALTSHCHFTAEVFPVPSDGAPLSPDAVPAYSLSWISRSAQKASCKSAGKTGMISITTEATSYEDAGIYLNLQADYTLPGQPAVNLETHVVLTDGIPMWISRESNGNKGLDFRITALLQLPDGSPYSDVVLILRDGQTIPYQQSESTFSLREIEPGAWLSVYRYSQYQAKDDPSVGLHPFFVADENKRKEVEATENIKPWFPEKFVDITTFIESKGIHLSENSGFAGYDFSTRRLFLFSKKNSDLENFDQLMSDIVHPQLSPMVVLKITGLHQTRLVSRSGNRASQTSTLTEPKSTREIEIEPTASESGDLVELRILYEEKSDGNVIRNVNTATTLETGKSLEVLKSPSGRLEVITEIIQTP
ncbi:MAG: hypothetical protein NWR21_01820 [Verrucomicrobiales bacterium]|nr:hypothetical protein [Verrucomicrobiales bacterium]